jgi:nucleoside-diphosphate-sugar epimerase
MRTLITGATGFIGEALANGLRNDGDVWELNRWPRNVPNEIVQDLSAPLQTSALPDKIDVVVHCAGVIDTDGHSNSYCRAVNVEATRDLMNYAAAIKSRHFILLSSGAIYGPSANVAAESSPVNPSSLYAQTKWAAEQVALEYAGELAVTILRLYFPYGPRQTGGRLIPQLLRRVRVGDPVALRGGMDGPLINPIFINDVVDCLRVLLCYRGPRPRVYNVAGPDVVSIRAIAAMIGALLGRNPLFEVDFSAPFRGNWVGAISKLKSEVGFVPTTTMRDGLTVIVRDLECNSSAG